MAFYYSTGVNFGHKTQTLKHRPKYQEFEKYETRKKVQTNPASQTKQGICKRD